MAHEQLVRVAYETLYGEPMPYSAEIKFSGRFKGYNANVMLKRNHLTFSMSRKWYRVSKEIKVGLIQELLVKITKKKAHTINMDLYNYFLRSIDKTIQVTNSDPIIEESFHRLNAKYFYGLMDKPNLTWGSMSTTMLGHYSFGEDQITISRIFHPDHCEDQTMMEFVLYHEMLHKHHKFESSHGRTRSHTPEFRRDEAKFPNMKEVEKRMNLHASKHKYKNKKPRKPRWRLW